MSALESDFEYSLLVHFIKNQLILSFQTWESRCVDVVLFTTRLYCLVTHTGYLRMQNRNHSTYQTLKYYGTYLWLVELGSVCARVPYTSG
jgi:hypothetical protein